MQRSVGVAAVVALLAIAAAGLAWTADSDHPESLPRVESHGLDQDQAACLSYGMVIKRSEAIDLTLQLGKYQGLDPDAAADLQREIALVDLVSQEHPAVDTRLVRAFDDVASEGELVLASTDILTYRDAVTGRSAELAESRERCLQIADFDIETLAVGEELP